MDIQWRFLCGDTACYGFQVSAFDYFNKLVSIWREQCHSINRRLSGSMLIEQGSNEFKNIWMQISTDVATQQGPFELRKLVPKSTIFSSKCYEMSFYIGDLSVVFWPMQLDANFKEIKNPHVQSPYMITCCEVSESSLRLSLSVPACYSDSEYRWLLNFAYPSLFKWFRNIDPHRISKLTNRLLNIENYTLRYRRIKETFGKPIIEKWTEKTDPQKFVYEECGIASYLLELWGQHGQIPRRFADIGCGNGLLVHLLNKEGVDGIGVDIRKRKIWSSQFSDTILIETTVDPTQGLDKYLSQEIDYLIGNHSDELTPWLPIMAARMKCNFFVLPCCPYNFHGKFCSRKNDSGSQYESFLQFIREICLSLGFIVDEDRLSIPSTKRVSSFSDLFVLYYCYVFMYFFLKLCFVCSIPKSGLVSNIEEVISNWIGADYKPFIARPKKESIRNCLNIPSDIRVNLTSRLFKFILEYSDERKDGWRCGGLVNITDLVNLLTNEEKHLMKQQNGGLQTFLKNQHQVFKVIGGIARLRDWRETGGKILGSPSGMTPCWMMANHPDGCPVGPSNCRFKH